ncbi:class I SAM-dependent methyltransferase [Lutimaribacter saemankumensis]|uniref:Methyltransferase domain-containing protein n=1 Tax=Lutimaribacter saemankumensis TaxID=490829 RepID=A0A1G8TS00_9RHOB|nr:class I SAM-dependent methyltransferase [Lutimaribacter saemankumensis]SDJ44376.1 Methyltransferase domain-containing protein [Lutimaribacter saemankumensis]
MSDFAEFGAREKEGWANGAIVDAYIKHFVPVTDHVGKYIAENHIVAQDKVLDLCCGQGTLTAVMSEKGANVTGLDFSPEMLAKARGAAPSAEIVEGDAMAMPFEDAVFDKVVCNFGMMHIPDQPKTLSEIRRVLKPNGEFIMATWIGPAASPAFAAVFGALKTHADFSAAPAQPDLFAFAGRDYAEATMAAARLALLNHETVDCEWVLEQPTELFDIFLNATVGAGMLIRSQTDETIEKIAASIAETVSNKFSYGSKFHVPVPFAVISAKAS